MSNEHLPPLPSLAQYKAGFVQIREHITPKQMKILECLFNAPGQTMTAGQIAKKVGYENYRGTNLQIGLLSKALRDAIGYSASDARDIESYVLCHFVQPQAAGDEWQLIMHPVVYQALKELAWFK